MRNVEGVLPGLTSVLGGGGGGGGGGTSLDFSALSTGQLDANDGWSIIGRDALATAWTVAEVAAALNGKVIQWDVNARFPFAIWSGHPDGELTEGQVLVRWRTSTPGSFPTGGCGMRGHVGGGTYDYGITSDMRIDQNSISHNEFRNADFNRPGGVSLTGVSTSAWNWQRFQYEAATGNWKTRIWEDGVAEPETWNAETTHVTTVPAAGYPVLSRGTNPEGGEIVQWDWFSTAAFGSTAPGP